MYAYELYKLVKALHESEDGYIPDYKSSTYDDVIGECFELFFVNGCLYENGEIELPCFGCQRFYRKPEKYYLVNARELSENLSFLDRTGFIVQDSNGFRFCHVHDTKEEAIKEAIEAFNTLKIHIIDCTCNLCNKCTNCGCSC